MTSVLAVVEESLQVSLLRAIDDDRERVDASRYLATEEVRKVIRRFLATIPRLAQFIDN